MSFRQRALARMEANGFGEEDLIDALQKVIEGKSVVQTFAIDANGDKKLVSEKVTTNPKDVARGLMIADALRGGDMGLAPKQVDVAKPQERMYGQYIRARDSRIIAYKDPTLPPAPDGNLPAVVTTPIETPVAVDDPMVQVGSLLQQVADAPDGPTDPNEDF